MATGTEQDVRPRGDAPAPDDGTKALIEKAASGRKVTDEEAQSATDWLLTDEVEEPADADFYPLEVNIGTARTPRWVTWTVQPVDSDTLKAIQDRGRNRQQRRAGARGETDMADTNRRIVIAGTADPNLVEVANQKGVADPAIVLKHRFAKKPGVIDQLAAEILSLSGYDDGDIRDAKEVRAAGN